MSKKQLIIGAALVAVLLVLVHPCRTLLAAVYSSRAADALYDPDPNNAAVLSISGENMPAYLSAVTLRKKAIALYPGHPEYLKALADIYLRMGQWADTMENLGASLPQGMPLKQEAYEVSKQLLMEAISIEPTNSDLHLAVAQYYSMSQGYSTVADQELRKAVQASPGNTELRYAVAMQYLLMGMNQQALEHARVLARIDDSYLLSPSVRNKFVAEMKTSEYMRHLSQSYLFKAYEIAWRASEMNISVIGLMTTDVSETLAVQQLFLESKGVENKK